MVLVLALDCVEHPGVEVSQLQNHSGSDFLSLHFHILVNDPFPNRLFGFGFDWLALFIGFLFLLWLFAFQVFQLEIFVLLVENVSLGYQTSHS